MYIESFSATSYQLVLSRVTGWTYPHPMGNSNCTTWQNLKNQPRQLVKHSSWVRGHAAREGGQRWENGGTLRMHVTVEHSKTLEILGYEQIRIDRNRYDNSEWIWIEHIFEYCKQPLISYIFFSSPAQYSRTTQGMNREQLHPSKPAAYRTTPLRAMEIRTFFFVVLGSPPWRKLMARCFFWK